MEFEWRAHNRLTDSIATIEIESELNFILSERLSLSPLSLLLITRS